MINGEQSNSAGDSATSFAEPTSQVFAPPHSDIGNERAGITNADASDEHALLPRPAAPQGRRSLFRR